MVGRMYVNAPVSSNMITTTVTVIRITPLSAAAAPRKAYVPGVIHGASGGQAANILLVLCSWYMALTMIPTFNQRSAQYKFGKCVSHAPYVQSLHQ